MLFPRQPSLAATLPSSGLDIRQPWVDLAGRTGETEFSAKALFAVGLMLRYVESANAVLSQMRHRGFLSAFELLASAAELLGRCVHQDIRARQDPRAGSGARLDAGFTFIKLGRLPVGMILETNHFPASSGGYTAKDLATIRNFSTHGSAVDATGNLKADVELLHELRKALLGVLTGEMDPHLGRGPQPGAIDRFLGLLMAGDPTHCDRLADAAVSPEPLLLHGDNWRFADQVVQETAHLIRANTTNGSPPASGSMRFGEDHFQLYP